MKTALLAIFLALPLAAQTVHPIAKPDSPKIGADLVKPSSTQTEKLAIEQLHAQMVQVESNIDQFEAEFTKNHPGWQINVRTGEPIELPKPEVKPEVKK